MVKRSVILFIVCTCCSIIFCQNKCDTTNVVFGGPDIPPRFDILSFLAKNVKYPETAIKDSIEGKVTVRFWIDENGFTSEHEIIKGVREDLDEEVMRVAKLIKFDNPAISRGQPVGMCYQFPVSFMLSNEKVKPAHKLRHR